MIIGASSYMVGHLAKHGIRPAVSSAWLYHIYGELELVNMQKCMGVVVITTQYGRTTSKLLATVWYVIYLLQHNWNCPALL